MNNDAILSDLCSDEKLSEVDAVVNNNLCDLCSDKKLTEVIVDAVVNNNEFVVDEKVEDKKIQLIQSKGNYVYCGKNRIPCYNYIDIFSFKLSNLTKLVQISKNLKNYCVYRPKYKFSEITHDWFMFKTSFIKISSNPIKSYEEGTMCINNNCDVTNIINIMRQYDEYVEDEIKRLELSNIVKLTCSKKLIHEMRPLKLHFNYNTKTSKIYSEIINYNISNKYPKIEKFNNISQKDIGRFLKKGKEARFILYPVTWIIWDKNIYSYGSQLKILKMEIKFDGAHIESILDNNEINVSSRMETVTI
jgi:hypothetical protein